MKRIITLIACFLISSLIVVVLWYVSERNLQQQNSFLRRLPSHMVTPGNILDLKSRGNYIAGVEDGNVYIGNFYVPNKILQIDSTARDSSNMTLVFPTNINLLTGSINMVDSASTYTYDGNQPLIIHSSLSNQKLPAAIKPPYFTQAIHTIHNSFVLRVVLNGKNELVKYNADSSGFKTAYNLLIKQVDGIFCTDGNLIKVPNSNKILYVYYYRNQFVCADSNLRLLYKGKTIDTNSVAKIKVSTIKSKNQITLSAPPVYVNKQSTANEKYLFIHSGLTADNELQESLDGFSTIDVYRIDNGRYKMSFYLPDFNKKKLTDFKVYGKSLYALYDHYLCKYQLNF